MNYREFQYLCEHDKIKLAIKYDTIAIREDDVYTVLLNMIEDFFVEIYYNIKEDRVQFVKGIEHFGSLGLYWQSVSIKEIFPLLS